MTIQTRRQFIGRGLKQRQALKCGQVYYKRQTGEITINCGLHGGTMHTEIVQLGVHINFTISARNYRQQGKRIKPHKSMSNY